VRVCDNNRCGGSAPEPNPTRLQNRRPSPRRRRTPEPSPQVELRQVDGEPTYDADQGMPAGKDFFPIAAWFHPARNADQLASYKDVGLNMLVGVERPECANEQPFRASGIKTVIQTWIGTSTASASQAWRDLLRARGGDPRCPGRVGRR
jgi:hypothetical protein